MAGIVEALDEDARKRLKEFEEDKKYARIYIGIVFGFFGIIGIGLFVILIALIKWTWTLLP